MQLETYISDLLYRYDCVTVPEFGAFLTRRVSAKIHESTHTFYPPKKALSFNEQLQQNDGLLANYIAEVEKIPYTTALNKISKQIKSIKSYLVEGETIQFKNIGELVLNADGKIQFDPSSHINYLTDAFGLSHFSSSDITREVYKETVEVIEETAPITLTPEKRSNRNWLKYAATAVILLGLGGFGAVTYYNNTIENHNQLAQEQANEQLDAKVQEATFIISPLPAATLSVEKQSGNYHIVAGAFRVEANSEKKVNQLRAQGFKARQIGANRYGLHEVVYGSFETRAEAQTELFKIRKEHNRDAWLLIKKLK
ncbi:HU domain-containing protein [Winogradskyella thalassocola]|uniref:Sporulation related domain-containing protein n=1 Tax=Winogradskyella thalassocola TaxID=262004 RepID=A0A1G7WNW7_9FLAO|nr:SPOR domain-containing protein [Winogradskyella thalassocola]SDG73661.1 Sporulation related domain-containing protein [Winogradskyella thalassocola]